MGVFNIILSDKGILFAKRRDLPLWDLTLNENKTVLDCAIREAHEETGYRVAVEKSRTHKNIEREDTQFIFFSRIIGCRLIEEGLATKEVKLFQKNQLPLLIVPIKKTNP